MRTNRLVALAIALVVVGIVRAEDIFQPDDEGFIRNWLVLAPLPYGDAQTGTEALFKQQVPAEAKLRPKEGDKVKVGEKELTWKKHQCDSHMLDFNSFLRQQTDNSVGYAVCYLITEEKMDNLTLKTGSDDEAKVYLNGKKILESEERRMAVKDQDSTPNLTLSKAVNTIVFKIVNEGSEWQGCLRFTDKDGNPIKNMKVALKP